MATPTATNRSRQNRPKKFNFQPLPEINQDIGQLGRFPGDERPTHYFDKYFMMKIEGDERKMSPFDIEKEVSEKLKGKPSDISSSGRDALVVTVKDSSQSQLVQKISPIGGHKCEVVSYQRMNKSKGIIYVSEFDVEDATILQEGLVGYGVVGVEPATWIKPNWAGAWAFPLSIENLLQRALRSLVSLAEPRCMNTNSDQCNARNANNMDTL